MTLQSNAFGIARFGTRAVFTRNQEVWKILARSIELCRCFLSDPCITEFDTVIPIVVALQEPPVIRLGRIEITEVRTWYTRL